MKPLRSRDVSLYELALDTAQAPSPLQVSPTTFKSMLAAFLDVLIDKQIPATLWLKLPKGDVWTAEMERYRSLATAPYTLYLLGSLASAPASDQHPPIPHPAADISSNPVSLDSPAHPSVSYSPVSYSPVSQSPVSQSPVSQSPVNNLAVSDTTVRQQILMDEEIDTEVDRLPSAESCKTVALPLGANTQLRREYLLLIISPAFCGLLVAHRPRSMQPKSASTPLDLSLTLGDVKPDGGTEDDPERRHPLLTLCSFDPQSMQRVLSGIGEVISGEILETANPSTNTLDGLVEDWSLLLSEFSGSALQPDVLSHLFTKQIQTQENMWHSTAVYRRQAESATLLQLENEEFQNAMRLKDEFLTTVGQELRTPLATMKTALSLLNSPNLKAAQRQRYMDMLTHECDRQSALITSVLDLLQLENIDDRIPSQPLRLQSIVPGIVSTYQPLAQEKGIMMAYTVPDELLAVSCTPAWLRQIVINLLHNGIKFTHQGGRVWLTVKPQGDYVQIEVRDTGVGISQSDIPKIFDRFYRIRQGTGDDTSGSGLGLSIVQQLLLRCGGSISVKSKLGEGSTFSVLLPVHR